MTAMQAGPEQLKDWMRRRGFTQADAARYLVCDESFVSMLMSGRRGAGLANAIKIERLTGIPVEAWAASEVDESEPAVVGNPPKRKFDKA